MFSGFKEQRKFLLIATKAAKPDLSGAEMAVYQDLLKPINESLMAVTDIKESNRGDPMYTQLSAVGDGIMVLAWVTVAHRPFTHVEEFLSSAQFFGNRVIKEYKDKCVAIPYLIHFGDVYTKHFALGTLSRLSGFNPSMQSSRASGIL